MVPQKLISATLKIYQIFRKMLIYCQQMESGIFIDPTQLKNNLQYRQKIIKQIQRLSMKLSKYFKLVINLNYLLVNIPKKMSQRL
jgi:hypothetical protein